MQRPIRLFSFLLLLLLTATCATTQQAQNKTNDLIAEGAALQLVSDQFTFTEGPAADAAGNVYFTDQPNNTIWKYGINDSLTLFMDNAGRSNGLYFDRDGNLLAAADEHSKLWSISPEETITVLVEDFEGDRLNGPNDIWVDPKGGLYFTDPYYQRPYWERTEKEIEEERVYYLTPDRQTVEVAARNLVKPNGIIGTPDGKTLYVADIGAKRTYQYSIASDGSLTDRRLFTGMGSDGMTLDARGNVYLTGDGVTVFNSAGEKITHIPVPEEWTANVTFGGRDRRTLFITASQSAYKLEMQVQGAQ